MVLNRFKASALHLFSSFLVGGMAASCVFFVWYPQALAASCGVSNIFLMMLGIDVVLGPIFTLLVFNPAKKSLRFDMAVILSIQVAALSYGMYSVFVARPGYVVFYADRFDLVLANDIGADKLAKVQDSRFKRLSWTRPPLVGVSVPSSGKGQEKILFRALAGEGDAPQYPEYYVPYVSRKTEVLERLHPLSELLKTNPGRLAEIEALERRYSERVGGVGFLPLKGKVKDLAVIVARDTAEVLEFVDLSPW